MRLHHRPRSWPTAWQFRLHGAGSDYSRPEETTIYLSGFRTREMAEAYGRPRGWDVTDVIVEADVTP